MARDVKRVRRGDSYRARWQLTQAGRPIPLTGVTEVRLVASLAPGQEASGTVTLDGACAIDDAVEGIVLEPVTTPGALELAQYEVAFRLTLADGQVRWVPDEDTQLLEVVDPPGP